MTRIAAVRAHYLRAELSEPFGWSVYTTPIRQAMLVEVRTDDGLVGLGRERLWDAVAGGRRVRRGCAGAARYRHGPVRPGCHRPEGGRHVGPGRLDRRLRRSSAWSGLEVALWDIMGKAVGRPVSQLLGGRVRERIMAYATGLYYVPTAGIRRGHVRMRHAGMSSAATAP